MALYWLVRAAFENFTIALARVTLLRKREPEMLALVRPHAGLPYTRPVNSPLVLWFTKLICYSGKDLRAAWMVDGLPSTAIAKYEPLAKWSREHWAMYFSFIEKYSPKGQIVDFGCGIGNMTANLALALPTSQVLGLDLNSRGIRIGQTSFRRSNLTLTAGDALSPTFSQNYDFAFCIEVLEHVKPEHHDRLVMAAMNVLRPGGLLFLTTPNALMENDHEWGHIGLLNSQRAPAFFKRFGPMIKQFGYLDNQKLESPSVSDFLRAGNIEDAQAGLFPEFSHFWVVLEKPRPLVSESLG